MTSCSYKPVFMDLALDHKCSVQNQTNRLLVIAGKWKRFVITNVEHHISISMTRLYDQHSPAWSIKYGKSGQKCWLSTRFRYTVIPAAGGWSFREDSCKTLWSQTSRPMKNLNNKHCINYHLWKAESDFIELVPNLWSWHKKHGTHDTLLRIKKAGIPQYQLNMSQWIVQGSITHFIWQ